MRIALTGGSGFLGSHLVPLLVRAGHQVRVMQRTSGSEGQSEPRTEPRASSVETCRGDVLDPESCQRLVSGCEVLVHLAGLVSRNPADGPRMYRLHIEGTRNILTAAAAAKIERVVLASTSGTIAVSRTNRIATEADDYPFVTVGRWPYYLSKIYQERLALELSAELRLPLVVLNPSLLLGPGDARFSSVGDVWKFLQRDIPAMPTGGLSFVDVRDVAETFHQALERGRDGERYLMGAVNMPLREFLERLSRLSEVPPPRLRLPSRLNVLGAEGLERLARWRGVEPSIDPASVEMGEHFFYLDSAKARDELGFAPRDPQETLRDTVRDLLARQRAGQERGFRILNMAAKDKLGHRPFERLKLRIPAIAPKAPRSQPKVSVSPGRASAASTRPPPSTSGDNDDASLFAEAVRGVHPLPEGPQRVLPAVEPRLPDPQAEDREVRAELESLVRGEIAFDLSDTDEFLEGAVADLDHRTRLRLRRGEFAVQAHLDLHGLTRDEARAALSVFLGEQRALSRRCVLVIHGRGLNSKDQVPVLKESMGRWLSRGALGRQVLGFCTARPCDGGAGALYVLLRR